MDLIIKASEIISKLVNNTNILYLIFFFFITIFSQLIATLKTIFVINKVGFMTYVITVVDALVYTLLVKALSQQTYITIILFILGKVIGTYLADIIESKFAFGIYDIDIFIPSHNQQKELQEKLLEKGISSTMNIGTVSDNKVRWSNNVQIKRKNVKELYEILDELNITNPTMTIRKVEKVTGKINKHI